MRTKPDDIAADVDEIDGLIRAARDRVSALSYDLAAASEVLDRLVLWHQQLHYLVEFHRTGSSLWDQAREHVRRPEKLDF